MDFVRPICTCALAISTLLPLTAAQVGAPANFGRVGVNRTATQSVEVHLSGFTSNPSFSLQYGVDYSLAAAVCNGNLTTCSIPVSFTPRSAGLRQDAIVVKDRLGNEFGTLFLHGLGLAPVPVFVPGQISTFVNPPPGSSQSNSIAIDPRGNLYVADGNMHTVRKVGAGGDVTPVAGNGVSGYSGDNGPAIFGELGYPAGLALDAAGNLYIADNLENVVREVDAVTGIITTVAGSGGSAGFWGDGAPAKNAGLAQPSALAVDPQGNLYICDRGNNVIREVNAATQIITTVAGSFYGTSWSGGGYSGDGGLALAASLNHPTAVALDSAGNLYIADTGNARIRKVNAADGVITTVAGTGTAGYTGDGGPPSSAQINPASLALDSAGNLYIADDNHSVIRQVGALSRTIVTVAGIGSAGYSAATGDGGPATRASLSGPVAVAIDSAGNLQLGSEFAFTVRRVTATPAPLGFSSAGEPQRQTVTVINGGSAALNVSSISLAGAAANDFTESNTCLTGIAPGASCSISITFVPQASGSRSAALVVADDAANSPQTISLNGVATGVAPPQLSLNSAALHFGSITVGTTSSAQTVQISNSGIGTLSLGSIASAGVNAADFSVTSHCGAVLTAGQSCTFTVTFTPTASGSRSAEAVIADNAPGAPHVVTLDGSGTGGPGQSGYPYLNVAVLNEIRFNDEVAGVNGMPRTGQYTSGDTWSCAWADDGNEYCTYNDGSGVSPASDTNPATSNVGLVQLNLDSYAISNVNAMPAFGTSAQRNTNGWTDGATWKTAGMAAAGGALYVTVQRQLDSPPWTMSNVSLIKSMDHGRTWCNYTHATATGCAISDPNGDPPTSGESMWPSQFTGPVLVMYCQDNSIRCPNVDGNDTYYYLTSLGVGQQNYYLMRVKKSDFGALDVSKYQYWRGGNAGGVLNDANWSGSASSAASIIGERGEKGQVYYIAALGQYVLINNTWHGMEEIWNAPTLGGPWKKSAVIPADDEQAGLPTLVLDSVQTVSSSPPAVTVKLQYNGTVRIGKGTAYPLTDAYSVHWKTIRLAASNVSDQAFAAANYSNALSKANMIADYAFLPELGAKITDYGGNGRDALANQASTYTSQGLWFNPEDINGSGFTVTTPATGYSGNDFTLLIAYRKYQAQVNNECLLSDGSSLSICRLGISPDTYVLTVAGQSKVLSYQSDGAWQLLIVERRGSQVNAYDSNSFSGSAPPAPIASMTASGNLSGNPITFGSAGFSGQIARFTFYASALSASDLLVPTEAASMTELAKRGIYPPRPIAAGEFPLDFQPPMGAWGVRRLLTSYVGRLVNVVAARGGSADIGFTPSGDLNTAALMGLCGDDTCYVNKFYDQSGNHYDLSPYPGPSQMAKIVDSGTLSRCGSSNQPCVAFDGSATYVTPSPFYYYGLVATGNVVGSLDTTASGPYVSLLAFIDPVDEAGADPENGAVIIRKGSSNALTWIRNKVIGAGMTVPSNTLMTIFSNYDSYYNRFLIDGDGFSQTLNLGWPVTANARYSFNSIGVGGANYVGAISEIAFWGTSLSYKTMQAVGNNQNLYYGMSQ